MSKSRLLDSLIKATFLSTPFISVASYLWLNAGNRNLPALEDYWIGDQIFMLGYPLTGIFFNYPYKFISGPYMKPEDYYWVTPMLCLLFIIQWTIWIYTYQLIKSVLKKRSPREP